MGICGRRFSFLLGMIGVRLILHEPAEAQSHQCEALFHSYSTTEIVDALVKVGDAWMTIAGSAQKPEMLGKADNSYINAKTVCADLTRAHVSPSQLAEELQRRRHARNDMERWRVEYHKQMLGQIAEVPAGRPALVDTPRSATVE
jgi:hypothetical protein